MFRYITIIGLLFLTQPVQKAVSVVHQDCRKQLLVMLKHREIRLRARGAILLEKDGGKRSVSGLVLALNDENYDVRASAAIALAKVGDRSAIPPLIEALEKIERKYQRQSYEVNSEGALGRDFGFALDQITGMKFGRDYYSWKIWWWLSNEKNTMKAKKGEAQAIFLDSLVKSLVQDKNDPENKEISKIIETREAVNWIAAKKVVEIEESDLKSGDLVMFGRSNGKIESRFCCVFYLTMNENRTLDRTATFILRMSPFSDLMELRSLSDIETSNKKERTRDHVYFYREIAKER